MSRQVLNPPLDPMRTAVLISPPFEHYLNHLKEEPETQGSPRDPPEDSTPQPIPTALAHARGSSKRRHLLIPSGPVPLPYPGNGRSIDSIQAAPLS